MNLKEILNGVVDIIYPPRCPICEDILSDKKQLACGKCVRQLKTTGRIRCLKCGKKLGKEEVEFCYDCKKKSHLFEKNLALWEYDENIKRAIYGFKYSNKRYYARFFADEVYRRFQKEISSWEAEVIIPVPLHSTKKKIRGYNQAELISVELSKLSGIPIDSQILIRSKNTLPQKEFNDKERLNNIEKAFQITENGVKYKKVILVDDIYTTGATLDECTKVLKGAGVEWVYCICLCIGRGY